MHRLLILLVLIAACGKYKTSGSRLGEIRSLTPAALSAGDLSSIRTICAALVSKAASIAQAPNLTYTFSYATKSCEEPRLSVNRLVPVTIENQNSSYKFKDGSSYFVFPEVETNVSGIMKEVCSNANSATPTDSFTSSGGNATWVTTSAVSSSDCNPGNGQMCILIDTGIPSGSGYKIVSKDWMKFQVDPSLANYGFYVERKAESEALCGLNKYTINIATLR